MADVNAYRRCIAAYTKGGVVFTVGMVLAASDAAVTATPQYWATPTDAELASGRWALVPAR